MHDQDKPLTLVSDPSDRELAMAALRSFRVAGVEGVALQISSAWEDAGADLTRRLFKARRLALLSTRDSVRAAWFPFVAGFLCARPETSVFLVESDGHLPRALSGSVAVYTEIEAAARDLRRALDDEAAKQLVSSARDRLIESGLGLTSQTLADCVSRGDLQHVSDFLTLGFEAGGANEKGVSLLALAVRSRHLDIARLLVDRGVDVNCRSADRGNTALMDAAAQGETKMLELLLDAGAEVDVTSKNGQTALMLAVGEGRKEAVRLLVARGADPRLTDALGMSALKYAELFKHQEIRDLLGSSGGES